jgi:hypothetical protein
MLRASMDCMEKGQAPTAANRARVLGRSRQAVWEFDKRHPDYAEWADRELSRVSSNKWGLVKNRAADLALQGSPAHMEVFCRMESGHYGRAAGSADPSLVPVGFTMNFLIPRPEPVVPSPSTVATVRESGPRLPAIAAPVAAASLAPQPAPSANIPTIAVRR